MNRCQDAAEFSSSRKGARTSTTMSWVLFLSAWVHSSLRWRAVGWLVMVRLFQLSWSSSARLSAEGRLSVAM